jgi:hypothetical protein
MKMQQTIEREKFESVIRALEAEIANVGFHLTFDALARQAYQKQIQAMSMKFTRKVSTGQISWAQAAQQASENRNLIMEIMRKKSTPVGAAIAQHIKKHGRTLNGLIAEKASKLYGQSITFEHLTPIQKNAVYAEIVTSAANARPNVSALMHNLSYAGKGLVVLSVGISVYTVATAENKLNAAGKEIAITGAGIGGGIAGGATAGLFCGPGAPVCVGIGAFVGGALAAFGIDFVW